MGNALAEGEIVLRGRFHRFWGLSLRGSGIRNRLGDFLRAHRHCQQVLAGHIVQAATLRPIRAGAVRRHDRCAILYFQEPGHFIPPAKFLGVANEVGWSRAGLNDKGAMDRPGQLSAFRRAPRIEPGEIVVLQPFVDGRH